MGNGIVENFNKSIKNLLKKVSAENSRTGIVISVN